jgi:4-amino-4-deoxy-L-arabinose transferase-like glycosyltransferase
MNLFSPANMPAEHREVRRKLFWMVGVALALRLVTMVYVYPLQLVPDRGGEHWPFGYETGKIAASIAEGHGFSNPLFAPTGPTAWMTPIYPYLIAGVFKVFGVYSTASALVVLTFNAITSALTCLPIFFFARRSFSAPLGERAGEWAGWIWAVFPYAIYWPVARIWDTWLATLLLAILFCMALRLAETNRVREWIAFGVLSGVAALTDPVVLSVLPFLALWALWRRYKTAGARRLSLCAAGCALATLIVIAPWFARNLVVFGRFIPFRDNFSLALRVGNIGDTRHMLTLEAGPWLNENEWHLFQRIGEIAYMRYARDAALDYISAHPREYVDSCIRRAVYVWTRFWPLPPKLLAGFEPNPAEIFLFTGLTILALLGLRDAFRKKAQGAGAYAIVLLFFPAVYYITSIEPWYRVPMDPMVIALAAYAIVSRLDSRTAPQHTANIPDVRDDSPEAQTYSRVSSTSQVA